jgi:thioredoxin reductase (NADPH)
MSRSPEIADSAAFPYLTDNEIATLRQVGTLSLFKDGEAVFRAGDELDLLVVDSGAIEIVNPANDNKPVVVHRARQFAGDIDLLTRRPVIVTGIARGDTRILRVPFERLREVLNKLPSFGETLLTAVQERRRLLMQTGALGLKVVGPGKCRDTTRVREFLFKNFVPFTWYDTTSETGQKLMAEWGSPKYSPVIQFGNGNRLVNPSLREVAENAGVWRHIPPDPVDLAVIGAGPVGMAAAVYAASEGVSTVVLDQLGPGGQASASSKIENFMGFPSGLSGTELATRSALQMLKFGARMAAPVAVERIDIASRPDGAHVLHLDCGTNLVARAVLIAAGVRWRRLDAEGADRFEGAGIHYACTSVEAVLYDKQDVAVVGGGNSAGQAAVYLSQCCQTRKVHLLIRSRRTVHVRLSCRPDSRDAEHRHS